MRIPSFLFVVGILAFSVTAVSRGDYSAKCTATISSKSIDVTTFKGKQVSFGRNATQNLTMIVSYDPSNNRIIVPFQLRGNSDEFSLWVAYTNKTSFSVASAIASNTLKSSKNSMFYLNDFGNVESLTCSDSSANQNVVVATFCKNTFQAESEAVYVDASFDNNGSVQSFTIYNLKDNHNFTPANMKNSVCYF